MAAGLGGFSSGFAGSDEPSHFVNALFVSRYLRDGFGQNPPAAAFDFYLHHPKFTTGQWPPLYYGLIGLVFLVVPASHETASAIRASRSPRRTAWKSWMGTSRTRPATRALMGVRSAAR